MDPDINRARQEIAEADRKIAEYFEKRMNAAADVAAYKKKYGLPIEDKAQEGAVIERNLGYINNNEIKDYYLSLCEDLMELSKKYQFRLNEGTKVAYNGSVGAFAYIAATKVFPGALPVPYESFEKAYESVCSKECDLVILPIENSYAGEVGKVSDLMFSGPLYVNGVYSLPVSHNLIGTRGAKAEVIKAVISHPQALAQCEKYIKAHGWKTIEAPSTTGAVQTVSTNGDPSLAAIGSVESAEINSLDILDRDINESKDNTTKFAVFSRSYIPEIPFNKSSEFIMMFTVNDEAGALVKALSVIGRYCFNMKALRSRPVREKAWQYYFYTEIEGDDTSDQGKAMIAELTEQCEKIRVIGHFNESGVLE